MLTVSQIKNVQCTINNNNIRFKAGVRSNYGANVINNTTDVRHEGSFLTDFLGTIKQSPIFYNNNKQSSTFQDTLKQRQESIENGLKVERKTLNAIA